jgi:pimeloyl-ACP methyl ester carboxylesterase
MGNGATLTRRDGIPAYAERFTTAGFTAVAFDYRHWGDSGGEPRGWVSISRRQDWRAAVAFARALPGADPGRVALWGMSFGGGLALATAAADAQIAAVIALVLVTDGLAAWLQPAPPAHVACLLGRAVKEAATRRPVTMPIAGAPGDFALLAAPEAVSDSPASPPGASGATKSPHRSSSRWQPSARCGWPHRSRQRSSTRSATTTASPPRPT